MSRRRTIQTPQSRSNQPIDHQMLVRLRSSANPLPICDQSSMLDQSITNQMSIYSNPVSIRCQSIPIRCRSCDNSSQLDADPLPARRQSYAKSIPNPLSIQLDVNSVPIQCWPEADLLPIRCTNRVPIHPNPVSIRCQSGSNPFQFDANPMPIQCQPDANQA